MSNAATAIVKDETSAAMQSARDYTRQQVNLIKQTLMPKASDAELAVFIEYAQRTRLDPFARQIYAIPVWDNEARTYRYQFTTGIDGLRLVAERTGEYQGQDGPMWCGADGKWTDVWLADEPPHAAKVVVYRLGRRPVSRVVKYREFVQRDRQGKVRAGNWSDRPAHQLAIRAESHALRAAFPREMAGLYVDDAIEVVNPDAEATNAQKGELMRLARLFGWTDEERHTRAGVASFTELTKGAANVLIDEWRGFESALLTDGEKPEDIEEGELVDEPAESAVAEEGVSGSAAKGDSPPASDGEPEQSGSAAPPDASASIDHAFVGENQDGPCAKALDDGTACGWMFEAHRRAAR